MHAVSRRSLPTSADALASLREWVHPDARRFRRFRSSFTLEPGRIPRPLEEIGERDVIICGCPRTGTSLLAGLLFHPPAIVSVVEPWEGLRQPPSGAFRAIRADIEASGRLDHGTMDLPLLVESGRVRRVEEGTGGIAVDVQPDFTLAIKWPTWFQLLPLLERSRFIVCTRDPYDTIASFVAIGGSLRRGLDYDVAFNREVNAQLASIRDLAERRVAMYDMINEVVLQHLGRSNVLEVRYERWFSEPTAQWSEIGRFLDMDLPPLGLELRQESKRELLTDADRAAIARSTTAARLGYS